MGTTARALRRTGAAAVLGASIAAALSVAPLAYAAAPDLPAGCFGANPPANGTTIQTAGTIVKTSTTPVAILDDGDPNAPKAGQGISFSMPEAGGLKVWDIDVRVQIDHGTNGVAANDVGIVLHAPNVVGGPFEGPSAVLSQGGLGAAASTSTTFFSDVTFDDQAGSGGTPSLDNPVTDVAGAAPTAAVVPEEALGGFRGLDASGTWGLEFRNGGGGPSYTVTGATITMRTYAGGPESSVGTVGGPGSTDPILQGETLLRTIDLSAEPSAIISDLDLVTHLVTSDLAGPAALDITLSNSNRRVTISTNNGDGGGGNPFPADTFDGTRWNDVLAPIPAGAGPDPNFGVVNLTFPPAAAPANQLIPEGAMSAFVGDDLSDVWTLSVTNVLGNGPATTEATLSGWSLDAKTALCAPDLGIATKFTGSQVPVGTPLTQTVTVTNPTTSGASGVVATVHLPAGATITSKPTYCGDAGPLVTCNVGTLAAGATRAITLTMASGVSNILTPVTLTSDAEVTLNETENTANNTASAAISVRPITADLAVAASGSPATNPLGGEVTYQAVISNAGPDVSTGTKLDLVVPIGASLLSVPGNCGNDSGVVTCNFTTGIAPGGQRSVELRLKPSLAGAMVTDLLARSETAGQVDPNTANNKATVTTNVIDPNPITITTAGTTIINNLVPRAAPPAPPRAKTWPSQVRFTLSKALRVRITVLTPGGRRVVGRIIVHGRRGQNVVVLPSRLKKYLGPKKPLVRVVRAGTGSGLVGSPDATLILVEKLGR